MDGRNGDPSLTKDTDLPDEEETSRATDVNGTWLSGERLSRWRDWVFYQRTTFAAAILVGVLLLGLGAGGYYWYQDAQATRHQQQLWNTAQRYGDPLYWPTNKVLTLNAEFHLATKWVPHRHADGSITHKNGEMRYKLRVDGYPDVLRNAWNSEFSASHFITVHLLDKDNFRVTSLQITLDKMVRTLNPRGEAIGLSVQGTKAMPLWRYRQISDWKIAWNL